MKSGQEAGNSAKHPRVDIQALRGLAVLLAVFYHVKLGPVASGWLGVDIFFVISGFLITGLVLNGIERGSFRLADFYLRRAKRLLPAAYVTFFATCLGAPIFLSQRELRDFAMQVVGAVTFTGNFVLWRQTGYFEGAGDLKPFLHIWSLAVEEQYYFLLPVTILVVGKRRSLAVVTVLLFASLCLNVLGAASRPIPTFFLLPTRAWELLIGTVGAVWASRDPDHRTIAHWIRFLFPPALACLLILPFLPAGGGHSVLLSLGVCASTLVVILRNSPGLNSSVCSKGFARIGDLSYSLYLVHWPILSFINNSWVGTSTVPPFSLRLAGLVLSFLAAYPLNRYVEDPIRRSRRTFSLPLLASVIFASITLTSISPLALVAGPASVDFAKARRANVGLDPVCNYQTLFLPRSECQSGNVPNLLVWGDSFAMHLVPGLVREWKDGGIMQATRSSCGPILGIAPHRIADEPLAPEFFLAWSEACIDFNRSVIEYLRATPTIEFVVLSSPFEQYLWTENFDHVAHRGNEFSIVPANTAAVLDALRRTVGEIRALGKKVVVVAPPPSADFNIGSCLERQLSGKVALGAPKGCLVNREDSERRWAKVFSLLQVIEASGVPVIRFDSALCGPSSCQTLVEGTMLYRDPGHLSYAGSVLIAERMRLDRLIRAQAK